MLDTNQTKARPEMKDLFNLFRLETEENASDIDDHRHIRHRERPEASQLWLTGSQSANRSRSNGSRSCRESSGALSGSDDSGSDDINGDDLGSCYVLLGRENSNWEIQKGRPNHHKSSENQVHHPESVHPSHPALSFNHGIQDGLDSDEESPAC